MDTGPQQTTTPAAGATLLGAGRLGAAYTVLGATLAQQGELDDALDAYRRGLKLEPQHPDLHLGRALALLRKGEFAEGWREYEWRWRVRAFPSPRRDFRQPLWDDKSLARRHILLHAEQGFGDTIQFARYAPLVAERAGRVTLECPPPLVRLLAASFAGVDVVPPGQPLADLDTHCPLLTLPGRFATTTGNVPLAEGYLNAAAWSGFTRADGLAVGVLWQGNPRHGSDRRRSIAFAQWRPVVELDGIDFYNLQSRGAELQPMAHKWGRKLVATAEHQRDFAALAHVISKLDLVITIDSAVAHLAGALGVPVWTLLADVPDWRWLMGDDCSPWYATARLFRQSRPGDWSDVMAAVAAALAERRDGTAGVG